MKVLNRKLAVTVIIPFGSTEEDVDSFVDYLSNDEAMDPTKLSLAVFIKSGKDRLLSANLTIPIYGGPEQKKEILEAMVKQSGYER
jgi:hypothetical protein